MSLNVRAGDRAPQVSLRDQRGRPCSLADHRGGPVVLYFVPKDDTPGCTRQACHVRDHWADFDDLGVEVAGTSPDEIDTHAAFARKFGLPHTLLAPRRPICGG